jgi:PAS domain S-box-containing protein
VKIMERPLNILIIEDSPADFLLVERHLRQQGMEVNCVRVDSAEDLERALDAGGWDIILSDFCVPSLDFYDSFARIKAHTPDLPVILVSGSVGEEQAVELLKLGLWDFILKENLARLVPSIKRSLKEVAERLARRGAEEALRESEQRFQDVVQASVDWVWEVDEQARYTYASRSVEQVLGYTVNEILGRTPFDLMLPADAERIRREFREIAARKAPFRELANANRHKDGTIRHLLTTGIPVFDPLGKLCGYRGIDRDITERKQAEAQIRNSLHVKEVLLKEIHHRVKNNLQIISSLLNLQANFNKNEVLAAILQDSQNRIRSMALVHEMLYRTEDLATIDFGSYLRSLVRNLLRNSMTASYGITVDVEAEGIVFDIDTAVPCGLMVNELVTNSLKHAFPSEGSGQVMVCLERRDEHTCILTVADTGKGLPDGFDPDRTETLGMTIVKSLTQQLEGKLEIGRHGGASFTITFKG